MKRRAFVTGLGAAMVLPRPTWGQGSGNLPVIGYMGAYSQAIQKSWTEAFVHRLNELGWIENRTVVIEYRWAEGRADRFAEIADEFVQKKVKVLVTGGTAPVIAAKKATSDIPIVFATAADPIGTGLVTNLARPGANVTGLSLQWTDLAAKRLELLREIAPHLKRLAIMANSAASGAMLEMSEVKATARKLRIDTFEIQFRQARDILPALTGIAQKADALHVCGDPLANTHRVEINAAASGEKMPTMYASREYVEAGGLVSYGASFTDLYRRAGDYVDKILRGTRAGELPIQQPTRFEVVINLKTAKAIGIDLSPTLLARADDVIE